MVQFEADFTLKFTYVFVEWLKSQQHIDFITNLILFHNIIFWLLFLLIFLIR